MEDLLYLTSPTPLLSRLKLIQKTDTYLKIKKIKMRHIADYLQLMK
jgi:hypothetical protein